jgi:O-6-methylguanine DNA methyltransferase
MVTRAYVNTLEPYVLPDIHNICSNIGSVEIPTESLVLCKEDSDFYCFSVHDVVMNIQKAEANNVTPRNPFTEKDFDPVFISRIKEMFMTTETGRALLESLPKANRDYNLVYGEVAPNRKTRVGVKGVTLSEFIAMNKNVKGKKFELAASSMLQDVAKYVVKGLSQIVGTNKYADVTTLIRAMDIYLQSTNEVWRRAISEQVGEDINSATLKQDFNTQFYGETKLKNPQRHNKMIYADELMQVEDDDLKKEGKKVFETGPIGLLLIQGTNLTLEQISFVQEKDKGESSNELLKKTTEQLDEYFIGKRKVFDLPLKFEGTSFQKKVWKALREINYGKTLSYKEIAEKINHPKAYRAVGSANNKNKLPIIIPCHRVIGTKGDLTGYAGGISRKKWLLDHEKKVIERKGI